MDLASALQAGLARDVTNNGDGTYSESVSQRTAPKTVVTGTASIAAINTDLLTGQVSGWYDVRNFNSASVTILGGAGISAGQIIFEATDDTTAAPSGVPLQIISESSGSNIPSNIAVTITASTTTRFTMGLSNAFFRVRVSTGFVGGTVQAIATFSTAPATRGSGAIVAIGSAGPGVAASGNPVRIGIVARTAQPTARLDNQMIDVMSDKVGRVITVANHIRDLRDLNAMVTLTGTTETTIVTAIASTFNDIEWLNVTSTATFSGTPTAARLDIRDTTLGTVRASIPIPLTPSTPIPIPPAGGPLKQSAVNTNWTAQIVFVGGTAPAISSGDIRITAQSVRNI